MVCASPPPSTATTYSTPPKFALECRARKRKCEPPAAAKAVDIEAVWGDALACKEALCDETDNAQPFAMATLPCGDVHVCCRGSYCAFLHPNEDRVLVCQYTGLEHGPEDSSEYFDVSGGTGRRSGDPDVNCGEALHGGFQRRADPMAASRAAFIAAGRLDDTELISVKEAKPVAKQPKRGARCVDEEPYVNEDRRSRLHKRNTASRDTCSTLQTEAQNVLNKLINFKSASAYKKCEKPEKPQHVPSQGALFQAALRKYLRACVSEGTAPCLDTVHNIGLIAQNVSRKACEASADVDDHAAIRTAKFRQQCSGLIVALWIAACETPYMKADKRNADAFRPFVAGCIYAMKRGVSLADGAPLVPPCPQLAAALPVLRGTGGNLAAKTLHSSSHRGLCTLSRCIASVAPERQGAVFGGVSRMAQEFASQRFTRTDV